MRLAVLSLASVVVLAGDATPAAAQIVNVQGSLSAEAPPGWSGAVGATADWRTGNVDLILVGGTATVLYHRGRWLGLAITRGEYGEGNGTRSSLASTILATCGCSRSRR